jgi:hypothetical protein
LFTSAFRTSLSPAPSAKAPFSQPPPAPPPPPLRVAMYPAPVDPVDPADPRTANRRPAASSILPPKGRCIFAFGFNSKKKNLSGAPPVDALSKNARRCLSLRACSRVLLSICDAHTPATNTLHGDVRLRRSATNCAFECENNLVQLCSHLWCRVADDDEQGFRV